MTTDLQNGRMPGDNLATEGHQRLFLFGCPCVFRRLSVLRHTADIDDAYRLSKRAFWLSFWFSWVVAFILLFAGLFGPEDIRAQAATMAPIYMPSMVLVILGVLGIHRLSGSSDLRSQLEYRSAEAPEGEDM